LVGYELSPVLWRKVKGGLSAGRVQSVAVRLIVDQERAIRNFSPEQSYKTQALFETQSKKQIPTQLLKSFNDSEGAKVFLEQNINSEFKVSDIKNKPAKKSPAAPFTTQHFSKKPLESYTFQ